jgi:dTDP-4-amino-4,6-dideoxygalactose transaminase
MRHGRHLYQVQVAPSISRDGVLRGLHQRNIGAGVHYRAVHLHPYYRDRYQLAADSFPVASDISAHTLSLPLSPKVEERDQDDVVGALAATVEAVTAGQGKSGLTNRPAR